VKIIVCIKQVPAKDAPLTVSGNWIKESDIGFEMNEPDSYALEEALRLTTDYLKTRKQFGVLIGSFQALKHRLADVWVAVSQARAASRYAAACLASGDPDAKVAVAIAKAYCSEAAVHAAQECVQLHGGIGFTWEHPAHLYLKRAKADSVAFGTPDAHRAALGPLVNLPAP